MQRKGSVKTTKVEDVDSQLFNLDTQHARLMNIAAAYYQPYIKGELGGIKLKVDEIQEVYQKLRDAIIQGDKDNVENLKTDYQKLFDAINEDNLIDKNISDSDIAKVQVQLGDAPEQELAFKKVKTVAQAHALHSYYLGGYLASDDKQKITYASQMLDMLTFGRLMPVVKDPAGYVKRLSESQVKLARMFGSDEEVLAEMSEKFLDKKAREGVEKEIKDIKKKIESVDKNFNALPKDKQDEQRQQNIKDHANLSKALRKAEGRRELFDLLEAANKDEKKSKKDKKSEVEKKDKAGSVLQKALAYLTDDQFNDLINGLNAKKIMALKRALNNSESATVADAHAAFTFVTRSLYKYSDTAPTQPLVSIKDLHAKHCDELKERLTEFRRGEAPAQFDNADMKLVSNILSYLRDKKEGYDDKEIQLMINLSRFESMIGKNETLKELYDAAKNNMTPAMTAAVVASVDARQIAGERQGTLKRKNSLAAIGRSISKIFKPDSAVTHKQTTEATVTEQTQKEHSSIKPNKT